MVDLQTQYQQIKPEIDAAIARVLQKGVFIGGEEVQAFATELGQYLGAKYVIPCANGTDALQIALMALGLQPGDEVITVAAGFPTTVNPMIQFGCIPVFVDVDQFFTIDVWIIDILCHRFFSSGWNTFLDLYWFWWPSANSSFLCLFRFDSCSLLICYRFGNQFAI